MKISYSDSYAQSSESFIHKVRLTDNTFSLETFRFSNEKDDASLFIDGSYLGPQFAGTNFVFVNSCDVNVDELRTRPAWKDRSIWAGGTMLKSWHNITAETHSSKMRVGQYFGKYQQINTVRICGMHLYVPFADSPNEDLRLHVMTQHSDHPLIVNDAPQVEGRMDPPDAQRNVFPSLRFVAPDTISSEGCRTLLQLVDSDGNILDRSCEARIEAISGYVANTRIKLVNGVGTIKMIPFGLEPGETMRVKAGLGYVTGLAEANMEVK